MSSIPNYRDLSPILKAVFLAARAAEAKKAATPQVVRVHHSIAATPAPRS
jgi:hypothetical protein